MATDLAKRYTTTAVKVVYGDTLKTVAIIFYYYTIFVTRMTGWHVLWITMAGNPTSRISANPSTRHVDLITVTAFITGKIVAASSYFSSRLEVIRAKSTAPLRLRRSTEAVDSTEGVITA